jgi:hypothetical protein
MLNSATGARVVALVTGVAIVALGAVSIGTATSMVSKATFVKVKCPGKTAQGKKVTCKVKGDLPTGPQGPAGAQGPAGPAGAQGEDGVSGYETIRETFTDVFVPDGNPNRGLSAVQTVACPVGKRAIGGGADLGTNPGQGGAQRQITVSSSVPTNAGDGWNVQLFNNSSFGLTIDVEVYAICARA